MNDIEHVDDVERIDDVEEMQTVDLQRCGLKILQKPKGFCFGMDSVLLAAYAKAYKGDKVVDLCTGAGVIPILMSSRYKGTYCGVEIQESMYELAVRNVRVNGLEERIRLIRGDIRKCFGLPGGYADVVTVNPPYMRVIDDVADIEHTERAIARHELLCTMEDVAKAASGLLKFGGKLFLVHKTARLADVLCALRGHKLEPKKMRFVHSYKEAPSKLFLLTAVKGASADLITGAPMIVYKEAGVYSDEVDFIYSEYKP